MNSELDQGTMEFLGYDSNNFLIYAYFLYFELLELDNFEFSKNSIREWSKDQTTFQRHVYFEASRIAKCSIEQLLPSSRNFPSSRPMILEMELLFSRHSNLSKQIQIYNVREAGLRKRSRNESLAINHESSSCYASEPGKQHQTV